MNIQVNYLNTLLLIVFSVFCYALDMEKGHYDVGFNYFKTYDNNWGEPINMGDKINTSTIERFPRVSPDGKYFIFMRHTPGQDIFWVSTEVINELMK